MPYEDQDGVHEIYREWRAVADSYPGERVLVGEVWVPDAARFALYLRPDELHSAFNFDFLRCAWDAAAMRAVDRRDAGHARAGRRAGDLGAVQPRRDPARHPVRPRRHVVRASATASTASARISTSVPAGPGPPRCSPSRCPAASTSTRATSSASGRSRTSRTSCSRTRCGSAPATWTGAATAAACRCRGRATSQPFGFCPDGCDRSRGCRSRPRGRATRPGPDDGMSVRCWRCTATRCASAGAEPGLGDGPMEWVEAAPKVLAFTRGYRPDLRGQHVGRQRRAARPRIRSSSRAARSTRACCRRTPRCGSAAAPPETNPGKLRAAASPGSPPWHDTFYPVSASTETQDPGQASLGRTGGACSPFPPPEPPADHELMSILDGVSGD